MTFNGSVISLLDPDGTSSSEVGVIGQIQLNKGGEKRQNSFR